MTSFKGCHPYSIVPSLSRHDQRLVLSYDHVSSVAVLRPVRLQVNGHARRETEKNKADNKDDQDPRRHDGGQKSDIVGDPVESARVNNNSDSKLKTDNHPCPKPARVHCDE